MIKKIVLFCSIILISIVCLTGCEQKKEIKDTGSFNETSFETEDYKVDIYSNVSGHPEGIYKFMTCYNKMYKRNEYDMKFSVSLGLDLVNEPIENYSIMKDIKLFDKDLKYKELSDNEIIIVYKYDDEAYLTINVEDRTVFYNKEGNRIEDENYNSIKMEEYDLADMLVKDKDFSNTLSFEISKK